MESDSPSVIPSSSGGGSGVAFGVAFGVTVGVDVVQCVVSSERAAMTISVNKSFFFIVVSLLLLDLVGAVGNLDIGTDCLYCSDCKTDGIG